MFVLKICVQDGVSCGWKVRCGVPDSAPAFPQRGLDLLWIVEPCAVRISDAAERLKAVVKLAPDAVLVGLAWTSGSGAALPWAQRGAPLPGAFVTPSGEPRGGMAGQQGLSVPAKVGHPGGERADGMEWVRRKQSLAERLPDGVGTWAVAPGLPPTSDDSVKGKAANTHKAGTEWDGLVRRRGAGALCRRGGVRCGCLGVSAVAGVVRREVV